MTMTKGETPVHLNNWNLWLREGYPDRKTLALQVGGWALSQSPHTVKRYQLQKPEMDAKATLVSAPLTTLECDQWPAMLQGMISSPWWIAV